MEWVEREGEGKGRAKLREGEREGREKERYEEGVRGGRESTAVRKQETQRERERPPERRTRDVKERARQPAGDDICGNVSIIK